MAIFKYMLNAWNQERSIYIEFENTKENLSLKVKYMLLNRATLYKRSLNEETLLKSESEISSFINDGI